jgi:hypothetical protein
MRIDHVRDRATARVLKALRVKPEPSYLYADLDPEFKALAARVRPYTMTTVERLWGLREAVQYVVRENIRGDAVECGVWRGGSSMLIALELQRSQDAARKLWMYDTFEGMTEPSESDDPEARRLYEEHRGRDEQWVSAPLDVVTRNLGSTGFPVDRLKLVAGKVEDTIPGRAPSAISLLRLDTDWYESTRHELVHLWPRLSPGGVLIIDDYGHWGGARKAVDEFFAELGSRPLFGRMDYTGRMLVKR